MNDPGSRRLLLAIVGVLIFIVAALAIGYAFSQPRHVLPSPSALPGNSPTP